MKKGHPKYWLLLTCLSLLVSVLILSPACTKEEVNEGGITPPTTKTKLVIGMAGEAFSYNDLGEDTTSNGEFVTRNIHELLVTRNSQTMALEPELATSWEHINPTTWRFHLRANVKFHDGSELDAKDVVASVNYALTGANIQYMGTIKEARFVDSLTVDIVSVQPDPLLPNELFFACIAPSEQIIDHPDTLVAHPIGTGPYEFVSWEKGVRTTLKYFEDYWGPKPTFLEIEYRPIPEESVRIAALATGEIDIACYVPPALVNLCPAIISAPGPDVIMVQFNTRDQPLLQDIKVRQALNYAIDRKQILDVIYKGLSLPANGQGVPASCLGYNHDLTDYPYDLERAKELIKEAGAQGKTLHLKVGLGRRALERECTAALASMWESAGLNIDVDYNEWGVFVGDLHAVCLSKEIKDTGFDMFWIGTGNETFLANKHFSQWMISTGSYSIHRDPVLDKMYEDSMGKSTAEEMDKAWQEIFTYIHEQAYAAYLVNEVNIVGVSKDIDWNLPMHGFLLLKEIELKK